MQSNPSAIYNLLYSMYPELKFWGFLGGILWVMFKYTKKVGDWAKDVKDNHLTHIQQNLEKMDVALKEQTTSVSNAMDKQTQSFVGEMKELRADIRGLTTAFIKAPSKPRIRRK